MSTGAQRATPANAARAEMPAGLHVRANGWSAPPAVDALEQGSWVSNRARRHITVPTRRRPGPVHMEVPGWFDGPCMQAGEADNPPLDKAASVLEAMGNRSSIVENNRGAIAAAARAHKAASIAVFGSVARGDDTDASDIDFLVEFERGSSLFDLLHLQDALEALLGCSVDVISVGGLTNRDDHIRREAVAL